MDNFSKTDGDANVLELALSLLVLKQEDLYVAYCPSLELSSYGSTIDEARTGFDEVIDAYLEYCKKNQSLKEDLKRHGWTVIDQKNHIKAEPPATVDLNIITTTPKVTLNA
ncbi:hypothetical protein QTN47_27050 [Danxiaibacter flavus]|uniref:Type II toxin-antitoxin system HicB family antitoxin n=1 Tax=Danxiaibacter flavus TaxID=3049108 RepID=A0ABV3ZMU0_9BACT|nr:hypothetical protein QNM32_27050 [Chitinophagaceae bacterium DXS]